RPPYFLLLSLPDALPTSITPQAQLRSSVRSWLAQRAFIWSAAWDGSLAATRMMASRASSRRTLPRAFLLVPLRYLMGEANRSPRSEEHTSELQSRENLVC